jgi:cyanate lyase
MLQKGDTVSYKPRDSAFSASVMEKMAEADITKAELAAMIGKSSSFVTQLLNGSYQPSPQWVNLIADLLELDPDARYMLHQDACEDRGFFK